MKYVFMILLLSCNVEPSSLDANSATLGTYPTTYPTKPPPQVCDCEYVSGFYRNCETDWTFRCYGTPDCVLIEPDFPESCWEIDSKVLCCNPYG